jgi:MFS superfamily sulfate permease-like transporter
LSLFPDNALAKESIRNIENNTLTEEINLDNLIISNPTNTATTNEESSFNFGSFFTITIIIFIISILSAIAVWFLLKRFSSIDFSTTKKNADAEIEEVEGTDEVIETISLEEVINLKLDNLETIWQKSKALKKLLGEIDEDLSYNYENSKEDSKHNKLKKMIDDSIKDVNLDEIENILDDFDNESPEENENVDASDQNENVDASDQNEEDVDNINIDEKQKDNKDAPEKEISEYIPEEVTLDEVKENWEDSSDSIKPDQNLKNKYNKIINEEENEILREAENFNDLISLIEDIEATNKDKGRKEYTQAQIESIFKTNFFEINNEKMK